MRDRRPFVIGRAGSDSIPWFALAGIVLLAAVPRVVEALRNPLSFDEIYVLCMARLPVPAMLRTLAADVEQPLHYLVIWAWRALGGEGERWLKSSSILFGLATLPAVFALARRDFGVRAGVIAAAVLGANAAHIRWSQYADMDTFQWLLVTLAFVAARAWEDDSRPARGVPFVLLLAACLYTYYFDVLPLTVLFGFGLARGRVPRRRWLWAYALAFGVFLPQLPVLWTQLVRDAVNDRGLPPMPLRDLRAVAAQFASAHGVVLAATAALALVPMVSRRQRSATLGLLAALVLPAIVAWLLSRAGLRLFFARQMLVGLPLFAVLVGAGAASLGPRGLQALAAMALVVVGLRAWRASGPLAEPADLARAQAEIAPLLHPADLVLCAETHAYLDLQYHLPGRARYRLLVVPGTPGFHYGDGILAIPDSCRITPAQWAAEEARGTTWWGVHVEHFPAYRDGAEAAALLAGRSQVPARRVGKLTFWRSGDLPIP